MPRRPFRSPPPTLVAAGAPPMRPADNLLNRRGSLWRLVPFGFLAVVAEATVLLPPGPTNRREYFVSVGLMILACALAVPLERVGDSLRVIPPVIMAVSIALLASASNGNRGVDAALLFPVLWAALYEKRWHAAVVICSLLAALLGAGVAVHGGTGGRTLLIGRVVLVGVAGSLIALCVHGLRSTVSRYQADAIDSARRVAVVQSAARELSSIQSAAVVLEAAVRICGELLYTPNAKSRRVEFLRMIGKTVHISSQFDASGLLLEEPYALSEHPYLRRAVETADSFRSTIDLEAVGPTVERDMQKSGVTHGAWIPIKPGRTVVGVIAISGRGAPVPIDLFEMCVTVGRIAELALASALTSTETQTKATTDELTGLDNYLGFELFLDHRPHDRPYVLMALDIDGLRLVNDEHGREVGDEVLTETANGLRSVLRRGDLLARLDGDQFAAYLASSQLDDGRLVAGRMQQAIDSLDIAGRVSISIGIACGAPDSDYQSVNEGAVAAMSVAKQWGGGRYAVLDRDRYFVAEPFVTEPGEAAGSEAEGDAESTVESDAGPDAGTETVTESPSFDSAFDVALAETLAEALGAGSTTSGPLATAAEESEERLPAGGGLSNGSGLNGKGSNGNGSHGGGPYGGDAYGKGADHAEADPVGELIDTILGDPALFDTVVAPAATTANPAPPADPVSPPGPATGQSPARPRWPRWPVAPS